MTRQRAKSRFGGSGPSGDAGGAEGRAAAGVAHGAGGSPAGGVSNRGGSSWAKTAPRAARVRARARALRLIVDLLRGSSWRARREGACRRDILAAVVPRSKPVPGPRAGL